MVLEEVVEGHIEVTNISLIPYGRELGLLVLLELFFVVADFL